MKTLFKSATAYRLVDPEKIGDLSALDDIPVADKSTVDSILPS